MVMQSQKQVFYVIDTVLTGFFSLNILNTTTPESVICVLLVYLGIKDLIFILQNMFCKLLSHWWDSISHGCLSLMPTLGVFLLNVLNNLWYSAKLHTFLEMFLWCTQIPSTLLKAGHVRLLMSCVWVAGRHLI